MEVISREIIKPSSPTPPHLRIYPLSFLDHITFRNYVPLVLFYPNEAAEWDEDHNYPLEASDERSKLLKKSFSDLLAIYYPLAGRFRDQLFIDCNDEGATFLVTRIKHKLSELLQNPKEEFINPLFADELQWKDMDSSGTILAIQINYFACGGLAIGVCMSHKFGDASTLFNLVNDWAAINRKSHGEGEFIFPVLEGGSIFPHGGLPIFPEAVFGRDKTVCRRFVFGASKIKSLKSLVAQRVENPTRVQVVTALIYKCAVSALTSAYGSSNKTSSLRMAVNLRTRMVPPLHDKSMGNLLWFCFVSSPVLNEGEAELHDLVSRMKEALLEFCEIYPKKFGAMELPFITERLKEATSASPQPEDDHLLIPSASWCGIPIYEADFGWGKPIWVTTSGCAVRNGVVLMDASDGKGIEALVNMEEQDMAAFERHVELLQYASLNPSISYS